MGLSMSHDNQSKHCAAVEYPCREREEVDQRVYRPVQDHRHCYQRLERKKTFKTSHMHAKVMLLGIVWQ